MRAVPWFLLVAVLAVTGILTATGVLTVTGPGARAEQAPNTSCVDVKIGDERYYDCVNRQLQHAIPQQRFSTGDAPVSASTPAPAAGTFNETAVRQQLGTNFGKSARPQRPPVPLPSLPLGRR